MTTSDSQDPQKPVTRLVRCPTCRQMVPYDLANPCRPFCSSRCQTADIAAWADERFRLEGPPVAVETVQDDLARRPEGDGID